MCSSDLEKVAQLLPMRSDRLRVGLNIGCATFGASHKRMSLDVLAQCFKQWMDAQPLEVLLTGAPNEREVNQEFMTLFRELGADVQHVHDYAGQTDMLSLTALIDACDVFVSTDSGPYHMAVGLKKPTLCWLMYPEITSYHLHPWVRCLINPKLDEFLNSVQELSHNKSHP